MWRLLGAPAPTARSSGPAIHASKHSPRKTNPAELVCSLRLAPPESLQRHRRGVIPAWGNARATPQENAKPHKSGLNARPAARRVAVVNQSMARRYFGDADPLGKRFYIQDQPEKKFEIVGVVRDVKY